MSGSLSRERTKNMRYGRLTLPLLAVLLLVLMPPLTSSAQGSMATPVPGDSPIGVLTEFPIDVLPTPHAEVWFMRYGLEPGGTLPAEQLIGPFVAYVESGELTLVTDQPPTVLTAGDSAAPAFGVTASPVSEFEMVLHMGESALVDDGTTLTASNDTNEPLTLLVVYIFAAERETASGEGSEPVGLTQQGISIARAEFPARAGTLSMERIVVEPGDTLQHDSGQGMGIGGIELGAIEQGSVEATFMMGSSWWWPSILHQFNDPQPIDPGATVSLTAGDGYYTFDGSSTWVVTGEEPLILLRVVIMPA
jgi:quercetin dioxygenase-like cupin family protein